MQTHGNVNCEKSTPAFDLRLNGLVHDLNNVFQTLLEATELLSLDGDNAFLSAAIARSIERGKNLVASILISDEKRAPLESILDRAISFIEDTQIAGSPQIRFTRSIESGIELRSSWDWERVLINLFLNAVCAMPGGGAIDVSARRLATTIEIVVGDEGTGIPPGILARVFQSHVSTRGSGLGLHIVETIVNQDGGEVRASNRDFGRGAAFTITVPCLTDDQTIGDLTR